MDVVMSRGFTPEIQKWIFASEGGYVDHPADPGGATNLGITHKVLAAWRGISPYTKLPKSEIKALGKPEAALIYEKNYWNAVRASHMPLGLDYALMDYAVNSGVSRAAKEIQRVVSEFYKGTVDGVLGTQSLTAIKKYAETYGTAALILDLMDRRWAFVSGLKTFKTFGAGWSRRIWGQKMGVQAGDIGVADRATMLSTASGVPIPAPTEPSVGHAGPEKPTVVDTLKDPGVLSVVGGLVTSIVGAVADQPVLQVALVAAAAFFIYRFVIVKQKVDPA